MRRIVPLILAVSLFMESMDATVIATSLPAIAIDIGASPVALKLALTSYLVSLAIFIPVSGWMADRFGAKHIFRIAIAIFIVGSVACAVSNSLGAFVVSRFLQGMGGAMMSPVARLVLVRATPKSELVAAAAWVTVPALTGPLLGPPVGGFITTYFSWHWIFLVNVPIGAAGILLAGRYLPEFERTRTSRLDYVGFVLSGLAASGIVFGLSIVSLPALEPAFGFAAMTLGCLAGVAYFLHARRTKNPLLALHLFGNPTFRASVVGAGLFRIGVGAMPFLLPLMFQLAFGLTPFQSGMITFVAAFGAIGMKFMAARAFRIFGFRRALIGGSLLAAATVGVNGFFTPDTPYALMLLTLFLGGFVRSMLFTGINALAFSDVSSEDTSKATPILTVVEQLCIALGVALAAGILEIQSALHAGPLTLGDFHIAFFGIALVSAFAAVAFLRLAPEAGVSVSGHKDAASKTAEGTSAG